MMPVSRSIACPVNRARRNDAARGERLGPGAGRMPRRGMMARRWPSGFMLPVDTLP